MIKINPLFKSTVLTFGLMTAFMVSQAPVVYATAFDDPGARTAGVAANGAGLEPSKAEVDGGEISVGATSQVVILFRNTQSQPIEVGAVNLYPSSTVTASVAMNDCAKGQLAPGAECPIALSISAFQTGPWRVEMLVRHSGRTKVVTATVRGTVATSTTGNDQVKSDLQPTPDKIDFGTLENGKPLVRSVLVRNVTSSTLNIKDVTLQAASTAEFNLETNCEKLLTGQACLISLSWSPKQKGMSEGFIVIQHDGTTGVTSIPITGKFDPETTEKAEIFPETVPGKGLLVASDDEMDFGQDVNAEATYTISLVNVGDTDLELQGVSLSGADNGVSIMKKGCVDGRILAPVEACPLTVMWSPVRAGDMRDDVQITHDGARGVLVVPVKGNAQKIVNQDSKTIVARNGVYVPEVERKDMLQGYVVTSHSGTRAIVSGPGGSRVVSDGQLLPLGGIKWTVHIVDAGVEMVDGDNKVLLQFDRSLSTTSRVGSSVGSGSSSSSASTTTGSTIPTGSAFVNAP